jgi:hypothetical protein
MPFRDFSVVRPELEDCLSELRKTSDPKERTKLLRRAKALIQEADLILQLETGLPLLPDVSIANSQCMEPNGSDVN